MTPGICVAISIATLLMAQGSRAGDVEEPLKVTVCQVLEDPGQYNHKLIEITGDVSRGFEDFSINDRPCEDRSNSSIWLELGGTTGSEVDYCCGNPFDLVRPEPLEVEGIATTLLEDGKFKQFQNLTTWYEGSGSAYATVVGRYFSGKPHTLALGTRWMGYGHFGMRTLLVIQQIKEVKFTKTPDFRKWRSGPR